ncbi:MAG: hypothetical protein GDA47_02390, partial [Rhodospirillales bacterium]|nr:hypothetical protein [Rhodospirillales bacterium]
MTASLRYLSPFLLTLAMLAGTAAVAREPLMQEGTTSIPQRTLSRPDASVVSAPGGDKVVEDPVPFTLYYIFDRQQVGGKEWMEVGPNRNGDPVGWLPAEAGV